MTSLNDLKTLADALLHAERREEELELMLDKAKNYIKLLKEETLPSVMQELGMQKFVLETGEKIEIKQDVHCSLSNENKVEAYQWLDDNGFGGLIKINVEVCFGKGEIEKAKKLVRRLAKVGLDVSGKESVHASTMKAFLKEQISSGGNVPLDLFGAMPIFTTKIK